MKKYFDNMVFCALRRVCGACKKGGDGMAGEKILIVDDDKNICELLRLYLETARPRSRRSSAKSQTLFCWT